MYRTLCFTLVLAPLWLGCAAGVRPITEAAPHVASPRAPEAAVVPLGTLLAQAPASPPGDGAAAQPEVASGYTCPMHHEIHLAKPGKCPLCGMTLIPAPAPSAPPTAPAAPEGGQR